VHQAMSSTRQWADLPTLWVALVSIHILIDEMGRH